MFKFNFSQVLDYPIDHEDEESLEGHESIRIEHDDDVDDGEQQQQMQSAVCAEIPLEELLKTLSSTITYTPLIVNTTPSNDHQHQQCPIIIPRRDLYDARFQIISEDAELTDSSEEDGEDDENAMDIVVETSTQDPALVPLPDEKDDNVRRPTDHDRPLPAAPPLPPILPPPPPPAIRLQQLDYIDAPSDVIPNVYEGGLKTWECSIDLVQYLSSSSSSSQSFRGKAILEVGCGTAIPTAYILRSLLDEEAPPPPSSSTSRTLLHLQDYNKSVLELVTIPNLLLAWYSSKASSQYRESHSLADNTDPTAPAELSIDAQLIEAFQASLHQHNIQLKFSAGSWSTFEPRRRQQQTQPEEQQRSDPPYDIVLTSETIYRSASVPALLSVLHSAVIREPQQQQQQQQQWPGLFSSFPIFGSRMQEDVQSSLILVAAKVLYFGVGGSVDEFEAIAKGAGAVITKVQETNVGVGRRIMKLSFL